MTDKIKVIYIYTDNSGEFKIGKADERLDSNAQNAKEVGLNRIKEQLTAGTKGTYREVAFIDVTDKTQSSVFIEGKIHTYIENELGFERLTRQIVDNAGKLDHKGSTEWFRIGDVSDQEIIDYVQQAIKKYTGSTAKKTYSLRKTQQQKKEDFIKIINEFGANVDILEDLCPRFGKTIFTLDQFKTLHEEYNKHILLLPTYVLTAHTSFKNELLTFKEFDDYVVVSNSDPDFEDKIKNNYKQKPIVALLSLHINDWDEKYKFIADIDSNDKVVVVDEADYGAHTTSKRDIINYLNVSTRIFMTGSAAERAVRGLKISGIISCSYTELLINEEGGLIQPLFYDWVIPNAKVIQDNLPESFQTKWSKLLMDVDKNEKVLVPIIRALFNEDYDKDSLEMASLTHHNTDVCMVFSACPTKKQHQLLEKLFKKTVGYNYDIVRLDGDNTSNKKSEEESKKVINKAKRNGKKVIILSMDMGSRSYSISEIDTVILMYDNGMLSQTKQKISRVLTPGKLFDGIEFKKDGVVMSLSFDANRTSLTPIDMFMVAEALAFGKEDETLQESVERICNSYPIFRNDIHEQIEIEKSAYAEELLNNSHMIDVAAATIDIVGILSDDKILEILSSIDAEEFKNIMDTAKIKVDIKSVQTFIERKQKDRNVEEKEDILKVIYAAIIAVNNNITRLSLLNDGGDDIDNILNELDVRGYDDYVKLNVGVDINTIQHLLDKEVLNKKLLNTVLKSFNQREVENIFTF